MTSLVTGATELWAHAILLGEKSARLGEELSVRQPIERLDTGNPRDELRRVPVQVFEEFRFCSRRPRNQNFVRVGDGTGDIAIELRLVSHVRSGRAASFHMEMTRRMGRVHQFFLRLAGVEMNDPRL